MIMMADETLRAVEKIKPSDKVLSVDPETGITISATVVSNHSHTTKNIVTLRLSNGETVSTTPRQRFLHAGGFSAAISLRSGARLNGRSATLMELVEKSQTKAHQTVWDVKLQQGKTLFVGADGVSIHTIKK
jgi:hypothetical protein